jgi:hypothetical protein
LRDPIKEILTGTASTILSAALGAFLFALFKAIRLCIRLRRISAIVRAVRNKDYKGFKTDSDMSLCDQAKQEVEDLLEDIEKEAEGFFRISRPFLRDIHNLKSDISDMKGTIFSDMFFKSLGYSSRDPEALDTSRRLSRRINRMSIRALSPGNFLLP